MPLVFDVINKYGIYDRIIPRFVKLYEPKAARPPRVRIVIRIKVLFLHIFDNSYKYEDQKGGEILWDIMER